MPVTVVTAASGTYENTLRSELEKADAPTLFQVNGPVGLKTWRDYCLDLRDTALYRNLKSDDFALIEDGQVLGVAYVIETYGLIYNRTLLDKYMALDGAVVQSADQINNFETLKAVAEDIQARREELGVLGAFTSAGMDASSDWRFKTHLANLPVYYEYKADGITSTEAIKGTYLDNYKQIWGSLSQQRHLRARRHRSQNGGGCGERVRSGRSRVLSKWHLGLCRLHRRGPDRR